MTYDNSRLDDDFRDSPAIRDSYAYREALAAQRDAAYPEDDTTRGAVFAPGSYAVAPGPPPGSAYESTLSLGYDDRAADEGTGGVLEPIPARERFGVHIGWELVLILAVGGVAFLLYRVEPAAVRGAGLKAMYLSAGSIGFAAIGMALSLRVAAPNLAIGPIAYASALFFADNSDRGLPVTAGVTALLAIAVGVAMALFVTILHVPAWAVSLGAAFGLVVWIQQHRSPVSVPNGAYQPGDHAVVWFGVFAGLSVLGGILGAVPRIRNAVSAYRPFTDPAVRSGGTGGASLGLVGSSVFAAVSGVLIALSTRQVSPAETGVALTALALGAALLGGTSVFGRRGGILGTALAVVLMTLLVSYADRAGWVVHNFGLAAAAIGLGLLVSRLVESLSHGREPRITRIDPGRDANEVPTLGGSPPAAGGSGTNGWNDRWGR